MPSSPVGDDVSRAVRRASADGDERQYCGGTPRSAGGEDLAPCHGEFLHGNGPDVGAIWVTSTTAPGVTHRWRSLAALTSEVANARIWAGFHYRFSTRVGTAMGHEVGRYVAMHFAPPAS